jgi:hypothetical protein
MGFIYRTPLLITRRQPFVDWANSSDDDESPLFTEELARRRDVYLVSMPEGEATVDELVDSWWQGIFEEQLYAWEEDESTWPADRTRAMFDEWFEVEQGDIVFDLAPDEPLTDENMDVDALQAALNTCAWCERELEEGAGQFVGFLVGDRDSLEDRESYAFSLPIDENRVVIGVVPPADSDARREGGDIIFKACSRDCERRLKKAVPPALRRTLGELPPL